MCVCMFSVDGCKVRVWELDLGEIFLNRAMKFFLSQMPRHFGKVIRKGNPFSILKDYHVYSLSF